MMIWIALLLVYRALENDTEGMNIAQKDRQVDDVMRKKKKNV